MRRTYEFPNLAKAIKARRRELEISQEKLSKNLGYKNGQFISNIERGLCSLPVDKIIPISAILEMPMDVIVNCMTEDFKNNTINIAVGNL